VQLKAEASTLPAQAAVSANDPRSARGAAGRGGSPEEENLRSSRSPTVQRFSKNGVAAAVAVLSFLLRQAQQRPFLHSQSSSWVFGLSGARGCAGQGAGPCALQCVTVIVLSLVER